VRYDRDIQLSGFQVNSNTTGFLHSEQMYELKGTLQLAKTAAGSMRVQNSSHLHLRDAGVLHRTEDGRLMTCWLGELAPGATAELEFQTPAARTPLFAPWSRTSVDAEQSTARVAGLEKLTELATEGFTLRPGDLRLIGWVYRDIPGVTVRPTGSQTNVCVMVLVHLRLGPLPEPRPDVNLIGDVARPREEQADSEDDAMKVLSDSLKTPDRQ
jgi:hypothetical protein